MAKGILLNCKPDQAIHLLKILQQLHRYETGLYYHTDFILFYPRLPSLFLLTFLFIQNYVKIFSTPDLWICYRETSTATKYYGETSK